MKKLITLLLVLTMVTTLFAGCGQEESSETKTETGAKDKSEETKETEGSDEKADTSKEPVTIKFATWDVIFKDIVDAFNAKDNGITVEMIEIPAAEYGTTLTVNLAGGGDLDVYAIKSNEDFSDLAFSGMTEPLDRFIERDSIDVSAFGPLYEAARVNGDIQALPFRKSAWVLYYNKDLFDAAGVDYPHADMNWDDYRALAKTMTQGEGEDKIWGAYVHTWPSNTNGPAVQTGSTIIDEDLSMFEKALELRVGLQNDGSIMPYEEQIATGAHYSAAFQDGNTAMLYMGEWLVGMMRNADAEGTIDFDWDIVPMPRFEGVEPNTTWGNATNIGINSKTDEAKQEAAWEFIKFVTGEEGQSLVAKAGVLPAALTDNVKAAYLGDNDQKPANISIILEQSSYPEIPIVDDVSYIINTIYKEEISLTLIGDQTPAEAIQVIKERIVDEVE